MPSILCQEVFLDLCTASVKNLRCAQIHTTEIQPERKRIPQGLLSSARPLQERDMGRQARIQAVRTDAARQAIRGIPEGSRRLATQDGPAAKQEPGRRAGSSPWFSASRSLAQRKCAAHRSGFLTSLRTRTDLPGDPRLEYVE